MKTIIFLLKAFWYVINCPLMDNKDGTVTDRKTGLMWQKDDDDTKRNWQQATKYAKSLSLGDYSDWRMPTEEELISLHKELSDKYEKDRREMFFPKIKYEESYWTGSKYSRSADEIAAIQQGQENSPHENWFYIKEGALTCKCSMSGSALEDFSGNHYVRCVRRVTIS